MTPHEEGFWNSLVGTLEDLPSHLLFSDWLEEQGRDEEALFHRAVHENKWIPNHSGHLSKEASELGWGEKISWDWWELERVTLGGYCLPHDLFWLLPRRHENSVYSFREYQTAREAYQALYQAWLQWKQKKSF